MNFTKILLEFNHLEKLFPQAKAKHMYKHIYVHTHTDTDKKKITDK